MSSTESTYNGVMQKIIYITPHLSTGGLPQYLYKKMEAFNKVAEVYCVEYSFHGDAYVVQRNKISDLLGDRFIPLCDNKNKILELLENVKPDVIHFEELSESFVDPVILNKIYSSDREYFICETCHGSNIPISVKFYKPDKFIMVSEWIDNKFKPLGVPSDILEYPIEDLTPLKEHHMNLLGLSPDFKHVVNIGLFTSGKNQKEVVEYAKKTEHLPIMYHFVGNTADNFSDYWEPILADLPSNCKIWGERSDVDSFYQAADLFLFTSIFELNPLSIKEALSWKLPCMFRKLDTYMSTYDGFPNVHYLDDDKESNILKMIKILGIDGN
jgi:glycosyltransferase involved in cell wall biosynthesis